MNQKNKWPKFTVYWIRGRTTVNFERPLSFVILGLPGSGKSSNLEALAVNYPKIIDIYGSRDNEGLAWCNSPLKNSMLFVVGDSIKIATEWDTKKASRLRTQDLKEYDVILSVSAFYSSLDEEFYSMNCILDKVLYRRTHWFDPWFLMVREASNFLYSRIKISETQSVAKAEFIYLLREMRHMGYAVGVDTVKWTSIDIDIRHLADFMFIKRLGIHGLPKELRFLYRYIDAFDLMDIPPDRYALICNRGQIGVGTFQKPFWHKEEKEDLLRQLNIEIEPGEVPDMGKRKKVGDFEHEKILNNYLVEQSMPKVAKKMDRSPATIHHHIEGHNKSIEKTGYCFKCKRINSELTERII